jgi:hypothetical protein
MTKLPKCSKCGSPITDSFETEIEQHGRVRTGHYNNGVWICHDCIEVEEGKKRDTSHDSSTASTDQYESIGIASASDVSPNTPRADET